MKKTLCRAVAQIALITLVFNVFWPVSAEENSKWLKIDDFEEKSLRRWENADTRNDTEPKLASPQVTELRQAAKGKNQYLIKKPAPDGVVGNRKALSYRALPIAVGVGETYTFFTRINVEYFPNNHVFGISNMGPKDIQIHDYNAFEPSIRVTDKKESDGTKNDGTLMVKTDKGYSKIHNYAEKRFANPLATDTWYDLWYVVNNDKKVAGGQVYDVYIRGGSEFPEQTLVYKRATFRMGREQPLIYFLANCNTGPKRQPYGNGGLRYDDIYMAKGTNLSEPRRLKGN